MIVHRSNVFVSTLTYELGKRLGIAEAAAEFQRQLREPDRTSLPVARVIARLRQRHDLQVFHGASTSLPQARSRAAFAALHSGADYWLMCDDDVECTDAALEALFGAVGGRTAMSAAVLPCLLRGVGKEQTTVNVQWEDNDLVMAGARGLVRSIRRGGTGMMLVTRGALDAVMSDFSDSLAWDDDSDGLRKVAVFQPMLHEREWLSEDLSFCERLTAAGVDLFAILTGVSMHAGNALDLESLR